MQSQTQWRQLAITTNVDEDRLTISSHLMEMTTGEEFTVSVTGRGKADAGLFRGAAKVLSSIIAKSYGEVTEGVTFQARKDN